jgi:hypothetical protein
MNTLEGVSSAQLLTKADPEEFDLVILGGRWYGIDNCCMDVCQ